MKKLLIFLAASLIALSCSQESTHIGKSSDFGNYDSEFGKVFEGVSQYAGTDELHSLVVLKDGKKIYEHYDTGFKPEDLHIMWSASKTFTATAIGFAVQDGLLSVNDRVISYFNDDELPQERSEWLQSMTIRDLLIMSSGLGTDGIDKVRGKVWEHPAAEVLKCPMAFEPGTKYKYNSMNTYLLSEIAARVTGKKTSEYLNEKLFKPLGINDWIWEESLDGVTVGGWGLYLNTEDFAKMGQFYLQKGVWEGKRLLAESWFDEATARQIDQYDTETTDAKTIEGYRDDDWRQGYCYQIWRCTHNSYRLDGAHGQICIVIPDKNAVVALHGHMVKGKRNCIKLIWEHIYPSL